MNWMTLALRSLRWRMLLLGASGGIWGAFLSESVPLLGGDALGQAYGGVLPGLLLGLGLGAFLSPLDEMLHGYRRRSLKGALIGAVLGLLAGLAGAALEPVLASTSLAAPIPVGDVAVSLSRVIASTVLLGLAGLAVGISAGLAAGNGKRLARRSVAGLTSGLVLGLLPALVEDLFTGDGWARMVALAVWGGLVALAVFWMEKRYARRWLRLLTSPGEDVIFPLEPQSVTLGKHESNDIPLLSYQEVFPFHCQLTWVKDHYEIVDKDQGGMVLVNYRQAQDQALKPGDLVKIGSALLQYGEAS